MGARNNDWHIDGSLKKTINYVRKHLMSENPKTLAQIGRELEAHYTTIAVFAKKHIPEYLSPRTKKMLADSISRQKLEKFENEESRFYSIHVVGANPDTLYRIGTRKITKENKNG